MQQIASLQQRKYINRTTRSHIITGKTLLAYFQAAYKLSNKNTGVMWEVTILAKLLWTTCLVDIPADCLITSIFNSSFPLSMLRAYE